MESEMISYGEGTATYDAVGGAEGILKLVTAFYKFMDESPDYKEIRDMHPQDLEVSIDKLVSFLSGWMGGEAIYLKKYGGGGMPKMHMHLKIEKNHRDMWLNCMQQAISEQNFSDELSSYLITQLSFPADRIYQVSQAAHKNI